VVWPAYSAQCPNVSPAAAFSLQAASASSVSAVLNQDYRVPVARLVVFFLRAVRLSPLDLPLLWPRCRLKLYRCVPTSVLVVI
jgi:hypothetical protein